MENKYGYPAVFIDESNEQARYRTNRIFEDNTPFETVHTNKF